MQVVIEVDIAKEGLKCWIFENDLLKDHTFKLNIGRKKVETTQEMLNLIESYMIIEEKKSTRFDNPTSTNTNFGRPTRK